MKQITLIFLIVLTVNFSFAQKSKVSQASSHLTAGKLDAAKEAIDTDLTASDEKTKIWYKAWFVRARIYQAISESPLPIYKELDADAVIKSHEAFMKALDFAKNEKKPEKARTEILKKIFNPETPTETSLKSAFVTKGATEFQDKKYAEAIKSFDIALSFNELVGATNQIDSAIIYYTGLSADNAGNETEDEAAKKSFYEKAIQSYTKAIEINYETEKAFVFKSTVQGKLGDNEGSIKTINEGLAAFPSSALIIGSMINYYINNGELDKALASVSKAIAAGNDDPSYLYTKGALLDKQAEGYAKEAKELINVTKETKKELFRARNNPAEAKKVQARYDTELADLDAKNVQSEKVYTEAIVMYDQTLAKKADYFDAAYNKGAIYYNLGSKYEIAANSISPTDDKDGSKFKATKDKADVNYKKALESFLKADEIRPNDEFAMKNLKNIYYKVKMMDKYKEMKEKLNNL